MIATIHYFGAAVRDRFVSGWREAMPPRIAAAGGKLLAAFVTEEAENNFPKLPVRQGENVFVSFTLFDDVARAHAVCLTGDLAGQVKETETLRLIPTARSRIHA